MAIRIVFDTSHIAQTPTFVLANKGGKRICKLPAHNIKFRDTTKYGEFFFIVNGVDMPNDKWEQVRDFKSVYCREHDAWYEIYVEVDEGDQLVKSVTAKSLGVAELSQINLYDVQINTEDDIARDDYVPTVLFNEDDPKASLIDRLLEKAPHYEIAHVDPSIAKIQRSFSFDSTSIYDAFETVGQEINCLFLVEAKDNGNGGIRRMVSVYDLESYCYDCGTRDEFLGQCPNCGSKNITTGYGKNTGIFVSTENLADNIRYSANVDSIKNCFKLIAGDDLMTATLVNCNPNGSGYIWHIPESVREDMSTELAAKLSEYDTKYDFYQNEYYVEFPKEMLELYNLLIEKYSGFSDEIAKIPESVIGYPALMSALYNTIDMQLFLESGLMPKAELSETSALAEAVKLTSSALSPVAVQDIEKVSQATANSAVLAMAKVIVDPRYQVKIKESSFEGTTWSGNFTVTSYSDEEDTAVSGAVTVEISDDYEQFVRQKLDKALSKTADATDIVALFKLSEEDFAAELTKYSLNRLTSFHDACQTCLDLLIEQGIADDETWAKQEQNLYLDLYVPYYNRATLIKNEIAVREDEIAIVCGKYALDGELLEGGVQTVLEGYRNEIQSVLNFQSFLGEDLWLEFAAYRREDTYTNDNYISDGLDNAQLFEKALEFIKVAKREILKSATLQHSITASLKNLLVMKEFKPIVNNFENGNWIRVRVDGKVYRLRMIEYEIDYDNLENLAVVFSDVQTNGSGINSAESIMEQAASMASSYNSVARQASQGKNSNKQLQDWVTKGLDLTNMQIVGQADNQNISWDSHGFLCKEYSAITGTYSDKQLKIINRGLYLTDDNWLTSRAGIGDFTFYNPMTKQMESGYGVIADTLVGKVILSEKVGVYNENGNIMLDKSGLTITADTTSGDDNQIAFAIRKKYLDADGNEQISQAMYINSDGDLVLNGTIRINSSADSGVSSIDDLADTNRWSEQINQAVYNESQSIYASLNQRYDDLMNETQKMLDDYKAQVGQYMQFDENGLTLGASSSDFKTVIDNRGLFFKQGDTTVSYVSNNQLYIPNAVVTTSLVLGGYFISPMADGGVVVTWQDD